MKLTVSALVSHLNRVVLLRSIFVCFAFLKSFKISEELAWAEQSRSVSQQDGDKPTRNFLDDPRRSGPAPDTDRKEGSRRHVRNWGGLDFDNVKTGSELEKEWTVSTSLKMGFGWFCLRALPLSLFKLLWLNYLLWLLCRAGDLVPKALWIWRCLWPAGKEQSTCAGRRSVSR